MAAYNCNTNTIRNYTISKLQKKFKAECAQSGARSATSTVSINNCTITEMR